MDPLRMAMMVALEERERSLDDLAASFGLTRGACLEHVGRLLSVGVIAERDDGDLHVTSTGWAGIVAQLEDLQGDSFGP
jgi:predicted transcriptional regulator